MDTIYFLLFFQGILLTCLLILLDQELWDISYMIERLPCTKVWLKMIVQKLKLKALSGFSIVNRNKRLVLLLS